MKLAAIVSATALGLALGGNVFAEDTKDTNQPQGQSPSTQTQTPPAAGDATGKDGSAGTKSDRDYQAEVKKCDSASDKQKCLDSAKKSRGNM